MATNKDALYRELQQKAEISQEGINFDPRIFEGLDVGGQVQEQVHCLFEYDTDTHVGLDLPPFLVLPNGLTTLFNYTRRSTNQLERDGAQFYVTRRGGEQIP